MQPSASIIIALFPPLATGKFPEIICFDLSSSSVITIIKPISVDISKSKCIKTKTTRMENCPLSYGVIPSQVTKLRRTNDKVDISQ